MRAGIALAEAVEAASATLLRLKEASAPSELVTPGTVRAAASAALTRSISVSVEGSSGSQRSRSGTLVVISRGSAMPQKGSSGTTLAMATARAASSSSALDEKSVEETMA
jgi:hypothetical protein